MNSDNGTVISRDASFAVLLDRTCERLREKQIQISLQKLEKLEADLTGLEEELDVFLLGKNKPIMNP